MVTKKPDQEIREKDLLTDQSELVLYNDEENTFDFVIDALVDVCRIEPVQAEQIAVVAHYKGRCGVRSGTIFELEPYYNGMTDKGLTVSIE